MTRKDEIHLREQDEEFDFLFKEARAPEPETEGEGPPEATIHGDLGNVDLSDIFQTITMSRMVGTLIVHTGGRDTAVYFENGQIRISPPQEIWLRRISRRLLASGLADDRGLRNALVRVAREGLEFDQCLAEETGIQEEQFQSVQVALEEDCLLELFTNRKGDCSFFRDSCYNAMYEARFAKSVPFDAEQMLFEVARKSDEWAQILEDLGSLSEIFVPAQPYNEQGCDEVQLELLRHFDGTQPFSDVAGSMLDSLFDVAKAAQALRVSGKIEKVSTSHLIGLAKIEVSAQHEARARYFLDILQELRNPQEPENWVEIASIYVDLQESRPAAAALYYAALRTESREARKQLLRRAHKLDTLNVRVLEQLHLVLADEDLEDVGAEYQVVLEKLASCYEGNDEFAEALEVLEELAEWQARSPTVAGRRARMLVRLGRNEEALSLLRLVAESLRLEKQLAGYGQVLEQILKIHPEDAAARKELHRIRSRVDPRLMRGGIAAAVLLLVGTVGWSFYTSYEEQRGAELRLDEAQQHFTSGREQAAEELAEQLATQFSADDVGSRAGELLATIRKTRREREVQALKQEQQQLFGGLTRAADAFEHGNWRASLEAFAELRHGIGKEKAEYGKKIQEAIQTRFGQLGEIIAKHLLDHQHVPLPSEDKLRSPQQRQEALELLDRYYGKQKCTAYLDLSAALRADERFEKLEGLPPTLLTSVEKWTKIARRALKIREELESELANDQKKVGIDRAFSDAEKHRNEFRFRQALKLYQRIVREYRGDDKLMRRFRAQRDALARVVALEAEIDSACERGDHLAARRGLTALRQTFPDLEFEGHVHLPLTIESRPSGARIFLDGDEVGRTPTTLKLTPDRDRKLEIRLTGFRPHEQTLPVRHGGSIQVSFELQTSWERPKDGAITAAPLALPEQGLVLVTDRSGHVSAHDLETGKRRWQRRYRDLSGDLGTPLRVGKNVILPSRDGEVRCLDATSGRELWKRTLLGPLLSPAVRVNDQLWVAAESGRIHRIDAGSGEAQDSIDLETPMLQGLVQLGSRRIFALGRRGTLRALDANGRVLWTRDVEEAGLSPMAASSHGLVVPNSLGQLRILDSGDGSELASLDVGDTLRQGVRVQGDQAILTNDTRELLLVDLVQRRIRLRRPMPALACALPSIIENRILVPLRKGGMVVYGLERARERFRLARTATIEAPACGGPGLPLVVADTSGRLRAFPGGALTSR